MADLVKLTKKERIEANKMMIDPDGWKCVEARANSDLRNSLDMISFAIEIAVANPDDAGCRRLLDAIKSAVATPWRP